MDGNGWIKLHRKLLAKGYYKNSQYVHLWVHLLLLANHKEHEYMHDGGIILIKEGQLITGRKKLSEATGIPETTIERCLVMLENEHQIGQQKTTKYRLITILNWKEHQERTGERTTNGQQADTYKNEKNEKELNTSVAIAPPFEIITEVSEKKSTPKKYPHSKEVFGLWGTYPRNWDLNSTQLKAAENLYVEQGLGEIKNALSWYESHKSDEFCPQIFTPYDLDSKWAKLENFVNKL